MGSLRTISAHIWASIVFAALFVAVAVPALASIVRDMFVSTPATPLASSGAECSMDASTTSGDEEIFFASCSGFY